MSLSAPFPRKPSPPSAKLPSASVPNDGEPVVTPPRLRRVVVVRGAREGVVPVPCRGRNGLIARPSGAVDAGGQAAPWGLHAGMRLLTLDGMQAVEAMVAGARVVTRAGVQVLQCLDRVELTDAVLVRVGAGVFGRERPVYESRIGAGQRVLVRDWRAQALYGVPQALVAAQRLVDGRYTRVEARSCVTLYRPRFQAAQVVYANGMELYCPES